MSFFAYLAQLLSSRLVLPRIEVASSIRDVEIGMGWWVYGGMAIVLDATSEAKTGITAFLVV